MVSGAGIFSTGDHSVFIFNIGDKVVLFTCTVMHTCCFLHHILLTPWTFRDITLNSARGGKQYNLQHNCIPVTDTIMHVHVQ